MSNDTFDFGFTATTVEELEFIQQSESNHQEETDLLFNQIEKQKATNANNLEKLEKLYNAILPLLTNLEKDADTRDYIYWPGRAEKIQQFRQILTNIYTEG
jgi:hypothetical protein|tara:strand:- start:44 stop:346 length:303 start_codon:yes stop_codon:yes gene_type:complete